MFILLLSGHFCCLGFCGVSFFCCLRGGVFYFSLFGRGPCPCPNSKKKNMPPSQTAKTKMPRPNSKEKKHAPPFPHRSTPKLDFQQKMRALHVRGRVILCCLGGWRVLFFSVWSGGKGGGSCFVFCRLGGDVCVCVRVFLLFGLELEFTHLPACLAGL